MKERIRWWILGVLTFALSYSNAWSSSPGMSLQEMTEKSELIFVGTVIESGTVDEVPGQLPLKYVNLNVAELLKRPTVEFSSSTVTLKLIDQGPGTQIFDVGERIVMFCVYDHYWNSYRLINGPPGMFRLQQDRTRKEHFVYSYQHHSLYENANLKHKGPRPLVNVGSGKTQFGKSSDKPLSERDFLKAIKRMATNK